MLRRTARLGAAVALAAALAPMLRAQTPGSGGALSRTETAPAAAPPPIVKDALGRDTPRGTVIGFMNAARQSRVDLMPMYLNTNLRDQAAVDLARKLFSVLDQRLPPRLNELSDRPEGSLGNPLKPDEDVIGVVTTSSGSIDLVVERATRGATRPVWLFSRRTLDRIPEAYEEIDLVPLDRYLPGFLAARVAGIRLFEWLAFFLLLPLVYRLAAWPATLLRPAVVEWRRRRRIPGDPPNLAPGAIRLLITAIVVRWLFGRLELPLLERQFWAVITAMLTIGALTSALLQINGAVERHMRGRLEDRGYGDVVAMGRLLRRIADVLVVAAAVLVTLRYFGIDPTAALAGLGIGGIAVALAAQKTLENVVGGVSIIVDKAVRVGDFLKLGDTLGTVHDIGLRSTRIRTLDRTILSVPNGQIANVNIETLSVRDKFWFHHTIGVRYETTSAQMRSVVDGIRAFLVSHPLIDHGESVRVRFFRFGASSLDIEVFAYFRVADWEAFLETQQDALLDIMGIIERAGVTIALPSQVLQLTDSRGGLANGRRMSRVG